MLSLSQALRLSRAPTVAIVGAGGKTTAAFRLAHERIPSMVSTTTHLGEWQVSQADRHVVWARGEPIPNLGGSKEVTLVTGGLDSETRRYRGLDVEQVALLQEQAAILSMPLFIESDGSRGRRLKAPAEHEPAIPAGVDLVVVTAGLEGLGKPLKDDHVHRPQIFAQRSGLAMGDIVTADALSKVLMHPDGGLRNIPPGTDRTVLLNQADTSTLRSESKSIATAILCDYRAVVVARLQHAIIHEVHERAAGIVLAAGASLRFGQPKQLLDYRGKMFVRAAAETALAAGLTPVRVVTGAHAQAVEAALHGVSVACVHNPDWPAGQGASVRAGIASLPQSIGAVVFLLADQPQVPKEVILALVEKHAQGLHPIIAPMVEGRRANPVLFDKETFGDLLSLSGDVGGRALFSKYPIEYLEWSDRALLLDIDTPEAYERLKS